MICTKQFQITISDSIDWSAMNWTLVNFFGSSSSGSVAGDTIQFNCTGIPTVESDGLELSGDLIYTGPAVNCKVTIAGGPFSGEFNTAFAVRIEHSVAGLLLQVLTPDITTSPQVFNFTVPLSAGDTITVRGSNLDNFLIITQGTCVGTVVLDNL